MSKTSVLLLVPLMVLFGALTSVSNGAHHGSLNGKVSKGDPHGHGLTKGFKGDHQNLQHESHEVLQMNFYHKSCKKVEALVEEITWGYVASNPSLAAKLLRLHYHDCFVRGCEASILLDSTETAGKAEKEARPNLSVSGYDVIDDIKKQIEARCPGVVSCADIVALAARDAVSFQFQRQIWEVPTGRRDGRVSLASEATSSNLPLASSNFTDLQELFARKKLSVMDLVALSGAHSIGVAHCGIFARRLFNFTGKGDADPSLNPTYATLLSKKCSNPPNSATAVDMDPQSSLSFDGHYYEILNQGKGLFQSDAALLNDPVSAEIVQLFQKSRIFFDRFAESMKNMGAIEVLTGDKGEIRKQCNIVNLLTNEHVK